MTSLFAWKEWSWRVVGISKGAVCHLKDLGYPANYKGLVRDHFIQDRNETYKQMLQGNKPMEFDVWWELYWNNDATIIMTKEEHNQKNDVRKKVLCYPLKWEQGYFACNPLIGFKCRKAIEGAYIKKKVEEEDILGGNGQNFLPQSKLIIRK